MNKIKLIHLKMFIILTLIIAILSFGNAKAGTSITCDFSNQEKPFCKIEINGKMKRLLLCSKSDLDFETFIENLNEWMNDVSSDAPFFNTETNKNIKTNFGPLICGEKNHQQLLCNFPAKQLVADCYQYAY